MAALLKVMFIAGLMFLSNCMAFAGPAAHDMWKRFMSSPNDQNNSLFLCPTHAPIHCIEGLCNYFYETGNAKIDLMPSSIGGSGGSSSSAHETLDNIMNYGVLALTPPDSHECLCKIAGIGGIQVYQGVPAILTQLKKTPVILKIMNWSEIRDFTKDDDFSPILHKPLHPDPDDFHYVVLVDSGIVGGNVYFDCMSSFGLAGDHGFFKIFATFGGEPILKKWCLEILYPTQVTLILPEMDVLVRRNKE